MEDKEIIKEVKNGNKELFGKIVEKYMRKVYSIALYYTQDTHLYKTLINIIRKTKRFEYESLDGIVVVSYDDPEKSLEKKEMIERLKKAIEKLDKKDKEIIYLRHFAELDYSEIAEVLNIPIGNVCSRLYYARKRLLRWMKE